MRRLRTGGLGIAAIAAGLLAVSGSGTAGPRYSGTIIASFEAPILTGAYLRSYSHEPAACDNSATAKPSGAGTATIAWPDDAAGTAAAPSSVTFDAASFSDVAPGQPFPLGTLTLVNGPDGPASLIFGFDLQLSAGDGIAPFTAHVDVVSTQNALQDRVADADVLSFPNLDAPSTLAAFEGASVTAVVYGTIGDDGALRASTIRLASGEAEHGCVDAGAFDVARGPCTSGCGGVSAALGSALGQPLCGDEQLPGALRARLRKASASLDQGATTVDGRAGKRAVRLALGQLRRAAASATLAAGRGRLSSTCAAVIGAAVADAEAQAAPLLQTR